MFCRECGQPISDTDKFCERCGTKTSRAAAVQSPVVSPAVSAPAVPSEERAMLIPSGIRFLPLVGLVAGILALVAIFTPWSGVRAPGLGISADASAWDQVINAKIMGEELGREAWACLALSGAIAIVLSSLLALATSKTKVPWGILGIITGGLLLAASAFWALADVDTGTMSGVTVTYGFGLYLALVAGIVACVAGVMGLLFDTNNRNALTDILRWFHSRNDVGSSEVPIRRQRTMLTWLRLRLGAAIALIGCVLALLGIFTPWLSWHDVHRRLGSSSAWDYIRQAEGVRGLQLHPHVYHWFVLVGALLAVLGVLFALAVPRLRLFLVTTVIGGMLALVGVIWYFTDRNPTSFFFDAYEYGVYLTLAGSIVTVVGGLLGLVMLSQLYKRRVSTTP